MKIIFIADFFANQVLGGGELNNQELISILTNKGYELVRVNSHLLTEDIIKSHKNEKFIIANFANISPKLISFFYNLDYIIYEHDHKYLSTRNPGVFPNFIAPKEHVVNLEFYRRAKAVLCQSAFHTDIAYKNTDLENLVNLGGNLWSLDSLEFMKSQSKIKKRDTYAIMDSKISHKNTSEAIMFCNAKGYKYNLIANSDYKEFLKMMSVNKTLVFLPKTPETLSRVVIEARMMNLGVISNKMIGAASEPWYALKGQELINIMKTKREEIPNKVLEALQ